MTSSTSLYPQPSGNANVASRNFTTLYSGSGEITVQEPGQYGNANVVGLLAASTDGANTIGVVSATGNIVTDAYFIGDGSLISNIASTYGNANVSAYLASGTNTANMITTGNVTGNYILGNGSQLTGIVSSYGNANVTALLGNLGSNAISTTGNVTAGYFVGNGSQLTGIVSTYGNANVSAYLASGTNTADMITTANIIGGNLKTSGASGNITGVDYVSANFYLGDGGLLSNISSTYGNANVSAYLASGNITANILTTGNVSATGNVTGAYILGNGSQLTGLPATYGNADVVSLLAAFGSNSISTTGNVTASYVIGNGSLLSNITGANVTGVVANAASAVTAQTVTGNAQANITSVGTLTSLSVTGNTTTGGVLTDNYYYANGTPISFSGSYGNANVVSLMAAFGSNTISTSGNVTTGNVQADNLRTAGLVSATGTITGSAVFATGNSTVGNLDLNNINSAANGIQIIPDNSTLTSNISGSQPGRIVIGNGLAGNLTGGAISTETAGSTRLVIYDSVTLPQSQTNPTRMASMVSQLNVDLAGTSWTNKRASSYRSDLIIGNGSVTNNSYNLIRAMALGTIVGPYVDTNGVTQGAQANVATNSGMTHITQIGANCTVGNTINFISLGATTTGTSNVGNVAIGNSQIGFAASSLWSGTGVATANTVVHFYGANSSTNTFGVPTMPSAARAAANYYFLRSDDPVAQVQLGSLRSYNEFRFDTATSGSITIDKANAQVQYIAPTANVTIAGYANMVTSLSDSVNTDQEIDTLTILVQQGATPYTVTLPTGSTYQYAGNISTVPAVANSRSILTVVAANVSGTVNYFTTVQNDQAPAAAGAGGANTQIQFNSSGSLAGNAAMTFDTVTGNIGLGNLIVGSNNTGNAEVGGTAQRINTVAPYTGITGNATAFGNGQIVIGNGYFGNLNVSLVQGQSSRAGKLALWDSANVAEVGAGSIRYSGISSLQYVSLSSNIANAASQFTAGSSTLSIGGGSAGNAITLTQGPAQIFGHGAAVFVGQPNTTVALGNTTTTGASGLLARVITNAGSTVTTGVGVNGGVTGAGNTVNQIGVVSTLQAGNTSLAPAKAYAYYMGPVNGSGSAVNSSLVNNNASRIAAEYYFLRNDDAVAQTQLGTLRSYNEYNSVSATTSGALTIDKAVSQVHQVNLAGNITSVTYANMVSSLSDSVNTDEEVDTVTIIFNQGATGGYSVALPTGATYKYAGGGNTVTTTANSVTLVAVTVARIGGTPTYLTTVSPGFV